jgi:RNA polymerase sigma-70 factor (ECF subfamily)
MHAPETRRESFTRQTLPLLDGLFAAAVRLSGSRTEAEDLVQETLLLAYQSFARFEPGTNLKAWLHRIQVNAFISGYRRARRERRLQEATRDPGARALILSSAQEALEGADGGVSRLGLGPTVQSALDALPEEFRTAVVLADIAELSYREIAETMGCPVGTVMSRLHRGRRALARELGPTLGRTIATPTPEPAQAA